MTPYFTPFGVLSGMVCLFAWNSPPKYGFNRWVLTLNVPFSGYITSAPPCEKTWVTVNGPDHLDFNFPGKKFESGIKQEDLLPRLELFPGDMFIMPSFRLFLVYASILISLVAEFI